MVPFIIQSRIDVINLRAYISVSAPLFIVVVPPVNQPPPPSLSPPPPLLRSNSAHPEKLDMFVVNLGQTVAKNIDFIVKIFLSATLDLCPGFEGVTRRSF